MLDIVNLQITAASIHFLNLLNTVQVCRLLEFYFQWSVGEEQLNPGLIARLSPEHHRDTQPYPPTPKVITS